MLTVKLPELTKSPSSITIVSHMPIKTRLQKTINVSRKINTEELYGSSLIKPNNTFDLRQIREEITDRVGSHDLSDVEDARSEYFNLNSNNIFQTEILLSPKYKEQEKGPIFRNGQLIKHSVVGPIDSFERSHKTAKKTHLRGSIAPTEPTSLTDTSMSKTLIKEPSMKEESSLNVRIVTARAGTGLTGSRRYSIRERLAKEPKKETTISKDELLHKINEMKKEEKRFYLNEAIRQEKLPFRKKIEETREERCLNKFSETVTSWHSNISNITSKINRDPMDSVMSRGQQFREKKEQKDMLETVKSDSERLGEHFWHLTLRKYDDQDDKVHCIMKDLPDGFTSVRLNKTTKPFQFIRSPTQHVKSAYETTRNPFRTTNLDRTAREYLDERLIKLQKLIKKVNPCDVNNIENLMVMK